MLIWFVSTTFTETSWFLDLSPFEFATFMICVRYFPRGEVSVKVGVMEFWFMQHRIMQFLLVSYLSTVCKHFIKLLTMYIIIINEQFVIISSVISNQSVSDHLIGQMITVRELLSQVITVNTVSSLAVLKYTKSGDKRSLLWAGFVINGQSFFSLPGQNSIPYLTLFYFWGGQVIAPVQRWGHISSAQSAAPNVTEGHISLLVVLLNEIRDIGWNLFSSSFTNR